MANEREKISKKTRFEVFKRDLFTCQYCGSFPPNVVLEIDHILAIANGGKNNIDNLITSCFDCNRGKSDRLLTTRPGSVLEKSEALKEKIEQTKAYERFVKQKERLQERQINDVEDIFESYFNGYYFSQKFRVSVKTFLKLLPLHTVKECMEKACSKMNQDRDRAIKYFCGVCWKIIKEK